MCIEKESHQVILLYVRYVQVCDDLVSANASLG
jgi:hypothetical protein